LGLLRWRFGRWLRRHIALRTYVTAATETFCCVGIECGKTECQNRAQYHQEFIHDSSKPG
jgi:hypothetical protein